MLDSAAAAARWASPSLEICCDRRSSVQLAWVPAEAACRAQECSCVVVAALVPEPQLVCCGCPAFGTFCASCWLTSPHLLCAVQTAKCRALCDVVLPKVLACTESSAVGVVHPQLAAVFELTCLMMHTHWIWKTLLTAAGSTSASGATGAQAAGGIPSSGDSESKSTPPAVDNDGEISVADVEMGLAPIPAAGQPLVPAVNVNRTPFTTTLPHSSWVGRVVRASWLLGCALANCSVPGRPCLPN